MIYQVRANILFTDQDEARDFFHDCELALDKGTTLNPDSENIEISIVELIANNHDQDPNEPCEILTCIRHI